MDNYVTISKHFNKYVISLDELDLALLPTGYKHHDNNTVLLWTNNNFGSGSEKYFEVEIHSACQSPTCSFSSLVDDVSTNNDMDTICHTCNTAVPTAYFQEHLQSTKHKSFKKITRTAKERIKQEKISEIDKDNLEYFCEHCVSVVPLSKRDDHEKTKTHQYFATIDTFLDKFASNTNTESDVASFINWEVNQKVKKDSEKILDFEIVAVKIDTDQNVESPANKNSSGFFDDDINTLYKEDSTVIVNKLKDSALRDIETRESVKEINNNLTDDYYNEAGLVRNLNQYVQLGKEHSVIEPTTVDSNQEHVILHTTVGDELIISVNNFHGFKWKSKLLLCKLCKIYVTDVDEHKVSEKHLKFITQPFEDRHCLRRTTASMTHCAVCNVLVENPAMHTQLDEHIKKVEQALVPKKKCNNLSELITASKPKSELKSILIEDTIPDKGMETNSIVNDTNSSNQSESIIRSDLKVIDNNNSNQSQHFCVPCNKNIHVNHLEKHYKGRKHTIKSKPVKYLMRETKHGTKCVVCKTSVPAHLWEIEEHVASVDHVIKYFHILKTNKIEKIVDNLFCKPCSEVLVNMGEITHIERKSHKIKLADYNISYTASLDSKFDENDKSTDDSSALNKLHKHTDAVVITDSYVRNDESTPIRDPNNIDKVSSADIEKKREKRPNADVPQFCKNNVKNKPFLNKPDSKKIKYEPTKQIKMDDFKSGVNSSLEELFKGDNAQEIHSHLQRTNVKDEVKCKVCTDVVSTEELGTHTNTLKHEYNFRHLLEINKLKLRENKYVCYACDVYIENGKELIHIESNKHSKRLESLKNGHHVFITADGKKLIDKIEKDVKFPDYNGDLSKGVKFGDFTGWKDLGMTPRTDFNDHYTQLVDNECELLCLFCRVLVPKTDEEVTAHANDGIHLMKYKDLMAYNQIFEIDSGYVCGYCESVFDKEFEHIMTEKHGSNLKKYRNKDYCFKCNHSILNTSLKAHVTSSEHIRNIKTGKIGHYYCNICDLQLTNSEVNIKGHTDGVQHKNNIYLMEKHKVVLENKKCFCKICESHFYRKQFDDHICSLNHIMMLDGDF